MIKIKKYDKNGSYSYALGTTVTIELLKSKIDKVTRVFYHSKFDKKETYKEIKKSCEDNNISFEENDKVFNILSQKDNCYVIGEFYKYDAWLDNNKNHVVLVNPSNAGNLGTIIRSVLGFGIKNIAIIIPAVDVYDPKVVRASMGALFKVNIKCYDSFDDYLKDNDNHSLYPFMLKADKDLGNVKKNEPFSLIFGNEASGLPDEYLNLGTPVIIKHSSDIDSLNLPIAVSVAMYEFTRKIL